jgi:hypothetical protein
VFPNLDKDQANNLWKEQLTKPRKYQSGEDDDYTTHAVNGVVGWWGSCSVKCWETFINSGAGDTSNGISVMV